MEIPPSLTLDDIELMPTCSDIGVDSLQEDLDEMFSRVAADVSEWERGARCGDDDDDDDDDAAAAAAAAADDTELASSSSLSVSLSSSLSGRDRHQRDRPCQIVVPPGVACWQCGKPACHIGHDGDGGGIDHRLGTEPKCAACTNKALAAYTLWESRQFDLRLQKVIPAGNPAVRPTDAQCVATAGYTGPCNEMVWGPGRHRHTGRRCSNLIPVVSTDYFDPNTGERLDPWCGPPGLVLDQSRTRRMCGDCVFRARTKHRVAQYRAKKKKRVTKKEAASAAAMLANLDVSFLLQ